MLSGRDDVMIVGAQDLMAVLDEYIKKKYSDWMADITSIDQSTIQNLLNKPLLIRAAPLKAPAASALGGGTVVVKDNKGTCVCSCVAFSGRSTSAEAFESDVSFAFVSVCVWVCACVCARLLGVEL